MTSAAPTSPLASQRRVRILQAAQRVLARAGMRGLRMDDIAREAGLSKGALYASFAGKDDLLVALAQWWSANELGLLATLVAQRTHPVAPRLWRWFRHTLAARADSWAARYELYALASRPGPIRAVVQRHWLRVVALLAELLAQTPPTAAPRPAPQARALALTLFLEGWAFLRVAGLPATQPEGFPQAWQVWHHLHPLGSIGPDSHPAGG